MYLYDDLDRTLVTERVADSATRSPAGYRAN